MDSLCLQLKTLGNRGETLMRRQCGEAEVEVFWERKSEVIQGRVCREGRSVLADIFGLPRRKVAVGELETVKKYLKEAAVRVQGRRIEVWSRLLLGGQTERETLKNKPLEELLQGIKEETDLARIDAYLMELDKRFEELEEPLKTEDWSKFYQSCDTFLTLLESEDINVFIRAIDDLIYALAKGLFTFCETNATENLKNVYNRLWHKINEPTASKDIIRLERLTRALGLILNVPGFQNADFVCKEEIVRKVSRLEVSIENLEIKCNLALIKDGFQSKNSKKVIPLEMYRNVSLFAINSDFRFRKESEELAGIDYKTYRNYIKLTQLSDVKRKWQWHCIAIEYIKSMIMYGKQWRVAETARIDLTFYVSLDENFFKESREMREKIYRKVYQAFWELENSRNVAGLKTGNYFLGLLKTLTDCDPDLPEKAEIFEQLIKQNSCCDVFWQQIRSRQNGFKICQCNFPVASFIGRRNVLDEIAKELTLTENTKILVLKGLGGIGKTQLGRKFVAENHQKYTMVYTLDAQSEETLNASYNDLMFRLSKREITESPSVDIRNKVNALLEQKENEGWLLVFDNADDFAVLNSLHDKLPQRGGCILITSRLAVDWKNVTVIEVGPFERSHSIELLEKMIRRNKQAHHKTLDNLAEALNDLPLALTQAGAYIDKTAEYNATKYLFAFQKSYADSVTPFTEFEGTVDYRNRTLITSTLDTSRESVRTDCPLADEALCLLAYLSPRKIPSGWIEEWLQNREIQNKEEWAKKIIRILDRYSMVRYEEENKFISIHPLVQQVVRRNLNEEKQKKFIQDALDLVVKSFVSYKEEDLKTSFISQEYLFHAISIAGYVKEDAEMKILEKTGDLLHQVGACLFTKGSLTEAEAHLERALNIRRGTYGKESLEIAFTLTFLGYVLYELNRQRESIVYYEEALGIMQIRLEKNHPKLANVYMYLGTAHRELNEWNKAEEFYKKALAVIGDSDDNIQAMIVMNRGTLFWRQGPSHPSNYHTAIRYLSEAKELYEQSDPEKYWLGLAICLNYLGLVYSDLYVFFSSGYLMPSMYDGLFKKFSAKECYTNAEAYLKQSFQIYQEKKHPDMIRPLYNFIILYKHSNQPQKIKESYQLTLKIIETFQFEHQFSPSFLKPEIGILELGLEETKSESDRKKVLEILDRKREVFSALYGQRHPEVAKILDERGKQWSVWRENEKALECYEKALRIYRAYYDLQHPLVASILNKVGRIFGASGKYKKAVEHSNEALRIVKVFHGVNHPEVAKTLNNLGNIYREFGEYQKALECHDKALGIYTQFYGAQHPLVADTLSNLGHVRRDAHNYKIAAEKYETALEIYKVYYGDNCPEIISALNNLGNAWSHSDRYEEAMGCYNAILAIYKKCQKGKDLLLGDVFFGFGDVQVDLGKKEEAMKLYSEALSIYGYMHAYSRMIKCLNNLGVVHYELNNLLKAMGYFSKACQVGRDHKISRYNADMHFAEGNLDIVCREINGM